jgi:DNA-3-methyladenine glycosylase
MTSIYDMRRLPAFALTIDFYKQNAVDVAKDLLGKKIVFGEKQGIITETEAYRGEDDPASHGHRGVTKRNAAMFSSPGNLYIYICYGIHHCLNIVVEEEGQAAAVLVRSIKADNIIINGPGKVCRYLNVSMQHNFKSLLNGNDIYITQSLIPNKVLAASRVGISKARDKLWRFIMS